VRSRRLLGAGGWPLKLTVSSLMTRPQALIGGMFALVGVPYYFIRTKPRRQAVIAIASAVGLFLLMSVTTSVADWIAYRAFAS